MLGRRLFIGVSLLVGFAFFFFTGKTAFAASVDLKANGSDGPISVPWRTKVTLSWTSQNITSVSPCITSTTPSEAETQWPANRDANGTYQSRYLPYSAIRPSNPQSITFTITCTGINGTKVSDSVIVNVDGEGLETPTPDPNPTPTPTPTPTPNTNFPSDPGPLMPCNVITNASFYYDKSSAVRGGVVPFRILLNSTVTGIVQDMLKITEAYQLPNVPTTSQDSFLEFVPALNVNKVDGLIHMGSADVVVVYFEIWCHGASGYDDVTRPKTYTWTIPDVATTSPTPTVSPTGSPLPSPTPCAFWDLFCTTPTPLPSPCPEGVVCITPEPSPTPISSIDLWENVPPKPTAFGETILSSLCNVVGCSKGSILQFIHGINPIAATTALVASVATSLPSIALNVLPQLFNSFQFFGSFLSIHKRKTRWGIVVDSDLGRPISRAIVQVFDAKFHQLKETQITGPDGQFGFLLPPGSYYLVVSESGFLFPARKKPPTVLQKNERIYLGEEFETDERDPDKIPHLVVPLDREEKTPVVQMLFWRFVEHALALVDGIGFGFLIVGAGMNTFFALTAPGRLNILFEVLYLILFGLKLYTLLSHQKGLGTVVDSSSNPLDLAIIRLYDSKTNRIVQTRVTNVHGRFFLLVPRGVYSATVAKAGYKTLVMPNIKISGNASKALALDFKLVPESSEGTGSGVVSSPSPTSSISSTTIDPDPVMASE